MLFACGFLMLLLSLELLRRIPLALSWHRMACVTGALVAGWVASRRGMGGATTEATGAAVLLLCVAALVAVRPRSSTAQPVLVGCAALANLVAFGGFNPVQSAVPMFDARRPALTESLDRLAARHPRGWLVLEGEYGAWLNGLGYASAAHVLLAPELDRFRSLFPELEERRLRELFNRSLYVHLTPHANPSLLAESTVAVPIDAFDPPTVRVDLAPLPTAQVRRAGAIESAEVYREEGRTYVLLKGWAMLDGSDAASRFVIDTDLPVEAAVVYPSLRPELARKLADSRLALAGFTIRLSLATKPGGGPGAARDVPPMRGRICIVSEDAVRGRHLLYGTATAPCALPGAEGRGS
jgi:hypothetical protein